MRDLVIEQLRSRFRSIDDITRTTTPDTLTQHLDVPKNKSIGEHIWCIVGARESYAKALLRGEWVGFSCSLNTTTDLEIVQRKLHDSEARVEDALAKIVDWTTAQETLLLSLLEHEATHEGQLIRHLLGLDIDIPPSVKWA